MWHSLMKWMCHRRYNWVIRDAGDEVRPCARVQIGSL